jgi:hypothetical protein
MIQYLGLKTGVPFRTSVRFLKFPTHVLEPHPVTSILVFNFKHHVSFVILLGVLWGLGRFCLCIFTSTLVLLKENSLPWPRPPLHRPFRFLLRVHFLLDLRQLP